MIVENGRIRSVEEARGGNNRMILPGFIDLHCYGGGGADFMDAGDAARRVAETHARAGTTAFLATTMTAPIEEIERSLSAADGGQGQGDDEAAMLGVHLEGPFISRDKLGAQSDFVIQGDIALMERLMRLARIGSSPVRLKPTRTAPSAVALRAWRPRPDRAFRVRLRDRRKGFERGRYGVTQRLAQREH